MVITSLHQFIVLSYAERHREAFWHERVLSEMSEEVTLFYHTILFITSLIC